jgi:hypothetical protein
MTKLFCDLCGNETNETIKLKDVVYDIHPHCGSDMKKDVDCCFDCLKKISNKLKGIEISEVDFDELKELTVKRK